MTQKIDTRKLSSAELLVLRRQAIRLRAQSSSFQDIALLQGLAQRPLVLGVGPMRKKEKLASPIKSVVGSKGINVV